MLIIDAIIMTRWGAKGTFMNEIYDPIDVLQNEIYSEVHEIKDCWQLRQIKRYIANIQRKD